MSGTLRARNNLILKLSEQITTFVFSETGHLVDQGFVEGMIDAWLPTTYAEAEAEVESLRREAEDFWPRTAPPCGIKAQLDRIRFCLGYDKQVAIAEILSNVADCMESAKPQGIML